MLEIITDLLRNPIINLVVAAVIGIATNIITSRISERTSKLWCSTKSEFLNSHYFAKTGNLRVTYKALDKTNRRVTSRLSATRIVFWNGGKRTLRTEDISTQEPLELVLDDRCEVLEVRSVIDSNPTITIQPVSTGLVRLGFEYLNKHQGAVFDVIYSGCSRDVTLTGAIKGGKVVTKDLWLSTVFVLPFIPRRIPPRTQIQVSRCVFSLSFLVLLWGTLLMSPRVLASHEFDTGFWMLMRVITTMIGYGVYSLYSWARPVVPKQLAVFYKDIN